MPEIPPAYRPTCCFKHGAGHCLCSGEGVVHDIWRRKTSGLTLILCPPDLPHRRLLLEGWLFHRYNEVWWTHLGLVYLSPHRLTYLRVHLLEELEDQRCILQCRLDAKGHPEYLHEVDLAQQLPLESPLRLRIYKLMAWEVAHVPFSFGLRLVVEPLDLHLRMSCNNVQYWMGRDNEIREQQQRRREKAAREQARRRAARAKAAAANAAPAEPRASPQAKHRPAQSPENQGLPVLMDAEPVEGQPAGAPRPQRRVRLLADGEEVDGDVTADEGSRQLDEGDSNEFPGGDVMCKDWNALTRSLCGSGGVSFANSD